MNTSKASARNCRLNRWLILVFLITEKSVLTNFGPMMVFRPRFPGLQVVTPEVVVHGLVNTDGFAIQWFILPVTWTGPVTFGRSVAPGNRPLAPGKKTVSGLPLWACVISPSSQPEITRLPLNGS